MADISKTRKIWEIAFTVGTSLIDRDKMEIVTWHKLSQVSFARGLLPTDVHVGDPIGSPCEPKKATVILHNFTHLICELH